MKTATILRLALLGALATAARAWDFTDELDSSVANSTKVSGASTLGSGESDNDEQRIYGGTEADASLYKYIVSLRKTADGLTYCGGSLIAPQYVLTAAHCVKTTGTMYASIGSKYASGTADGERIAVAEAYVHPKYDKPNHLYDVAILKLSAKSTVTPVALAAPDGSDNKEKTMAVVRGWGLTETKVQASTLQEVNVRIITNAECNKQYNNRITESMLCAGEGGGKDSCQGDSGGPLVSNNKLIGVVSWGGECGIAAGVYSRVTHILDFINEKIGAGTATNSTQTTPMPAVTTVAPEASPAGESATSPTPTTAVPATTAPATNAPTTAPTMAPTTAPVTTAPVTEAPVATKAPASSGSKTDTSSGSVVTTKAPIAATETVAPTVTPAAATKPAATPAPATKPAASPAGKIPGKVTCMIKPKNGEGKSNGAVSTKNTDMKQSYDENKQLAHSEDAAGNDEDEEHYNADESE